MSDEAQTLTDSENGAEAAQDGAQDAPEHPSREAAKYRTRLRAAEAQVAERDAAIGALRSEIDRLHRAEVERVAASPAHAMTRPQDIWLVADLDAVRAADGSLDHDKVGGVLRDALRERPEWRQRGPGMDGGVRGGGIPPQREASFGALLKGQR